MGLDMYLNRTTYIKSWNGEDFEIKLSYNGKEIKLDNPKTVSEEVGYWRKANQIHNWFVENVQNGEDDCKSYEVSRKELETLLNLCREVKKRAKIVDGDLITENIFEGGRIKKEKRVIKIIENKEEIHDLLPTCSGFFFGDTEYNEYYMDDIDSTIEILENVLKQEPPEGVLQWFEYHSSW